MIEDLNSMSLEELEKFFLEIGEKKFRAKQLFSYFHEQNGNDIDELSVFSKDLRNKIKKIDKINKVKIQERFDSKLDATKKYLFLLEDNNIIEGVFMEYPHGNSVCISTQVGCRMGCKFCASTKDGLIRNLRPSEMLSQIYLMEKDLDVKISNIVLMGSGEPLDNYDNVLRFLNLIHDEKGHNISYRNITLSTCGIVPKIYDLAEENIPITLSISLHSPVDSYRSDIMPIGKKYSIDDIIKACKFYEDKTKRRITFEYTLIKGVNDSKDDAIKLKELTRDLNSHVNLISLNPIKEYNKERPEKSEVYKFQEKLEKLGVNATVRGEKGLDISASCGQLRRDYLDK
ncbi:MAG TPA: 23S rRNA (adenine(2503)-C(2))-methyltransferase RlmN [Tissierellaceae bacterium]